MLRRYDTVNSRKLRYLAQFSPSMPETQPYVTALRKYAQMAKTNPDGTATIPIDYSPKHDRLFAESGVSLQHMPRDIRNFLIPDRCADIDIVNSAPTVIAQVCRKHGVQTPCLDAFLPVYKERCKELSDNPCKMKAVIFFSSNEIDHNRSPGWLKALCTELKEVVFPALSPLEEYRGILRQAERADREKREESAKRQRRTHGGYSDNVQGIFLSYLYFRYESLILSILEKTGKTENYWDDHISLMFDGMLVVKRPNTPIHLSILEDAVRFETGIRVKLAFKPTNTKLQVDVNSIPEQLVVTDGDEEAAGLVSLALDSQAFKVEDSIFIKHDGLWSDNPVIVENFLLDKVCAMNIKRLTFGKDGEAKENPYSCYVKNARGIIRLASSRFPNRPNFVRDMVLNSEGKLAFINGYWQFSEQLNPTTGCYGEFKHGQSFETGVRIERMFPPRVQEDIDFVMHNFIDLPFANTSEGTKELFLLAISRACAGHMDKVTNIMVGGRDSSKSVIMQFVRNTLGKYTCCIPSGVFAIKGSSMNDAYREGAWIFDAEFSRIGAISESTQTTVGETVFSGDTLKKFQSCKEGMSARKIRQNQREAYSLVTGFMLLNDIPRFEPADAIEKCHIYNFPNRFVSAEEKAANPFRSNYHVANPMVEQWIRQPQYQAALLWIIFEAYRPIQVKPNSDMIESAEQLMEETGIEMYDRLLDITLDPVDREPQSDVLKTLKTCCPSIGHARISRELQDLVTQRCNSEGKQPFSVKSFIGNGHTRSRKMAYRGVKIRNNGSFNGGGDGYSSGFAP